MATGSTRNTTSKTASRNRASRAKVADTAARVAELNDRDEQAEKEVAITTWLAFAERQGGPDKARAVAMEQGKKLAEWKKAGVGRRPNVKALDMLNAAFAAGWTADKDRGIAKGRKGRSRKYVSAEYAQAMANKKAASVGAFTRVGKRLTDEEALDYLRTMRAEHPGRSRREAQEISYWADCNAIVGARFGRIWDEAAPAHKATAEPAVAVA